MQVCLQVFVQVCLQVGVVLQLGALVDIFAGPGVDMYLFVHNSYLIYEGHNGLEVIAGHPLQVDEGVLVGVLDQDTPEEGGTST